MLEKAQWWRSEALYVSPSRYAALTPIDSEWPKKETALTPS